MCDILSLALRLILAILPITRTSSYRLVIFEFLAWTRRGILARRTELPLHFWYSFGQFLGRVPLWSSYGYGVFRRFLRSFDRRLATVLLSREKFPSEEEIRASLFFFLSQAWKIRVHRAADASKKRMFMFQHSPRDKRSINRSIWHGCEGFRVQRYSSRIGQDSTRRFRADVNTWWRETRRRRRRGARRRGDATRRLQSSSCFGPLNSSWEMKPFLSLSSCWKISSTSLSWSTSIFFISSLSPAPPCSASIICFLRYSLTCTQTNTLVSSGSAVN